MLAQAKAEQPASRAGEPAWRWQMEHVTYCSDWQHSGARHSVARGWPSEADAAEDRDVRDDFPNMVWLNHPPPRTVRVLAAQRQNSASRCRTTKYGCSVVCSARSPGSHCNCSYRLSSRCLPLDGAYSKLLRERNSDSSCRRRRCGRRRCRLGVMRWPRGSDLRVATELIVRYCAPTGLSLRRSCERASHASP